jgi:hypothetical protein
MAQVALRRALVHASLCRASCRPDDAARLSGRSDRSPGDACHRCHMRDNIDVAGSAEFTAGPVSEADRDVAAVFDRLGGESLRIVVPADHGPRLSARDLFDHLPRAWCVSPALRRERSPR